MKLLLESDDISIWMKANGSVEICMSNYVLTPIKGESKADLSRRISDALEDIENYVYSFREEWDHSGVLREEEDDEQDEEGED